MAVGDTVLPAVERKFWIVGEVGIQAMFVPKVMTSGKPTD
jgi:hypothetical protein